MYQSLLHLSWIDKLLDNIKTLFVSLYSAQLKTQHTSVVECDFGAYFDQQMKELEGSEEQNGQSDTAVEVAPPSRSDAGLEDVAPPPIPGLIKCRPLLPVRAACMANRGAASLKAQGDSATSNDVTPIVTPHTSRPATPSQVLSVSPGSRTSRRARKAVTASALTAANQPSGDEERRQGKVQKGKVKKGRKWGEDGMAEEDDGVVLDYSATSPDMVEGYQPNDAPQSSVKDINPNNFGTRTGKGQFVLRDLDDEVHTILKGARSESKEGTKAHTSVVSSGLNAVSDLFRNVVGGKVLTQADLEKAMKGMEEHLIQKNVAREAAVRLCESVERNLLGVKTGNFESKKNK